MRYVPSLLLSLCVATTVLAQTPTSGVTLFGKVQDAQTRAALPYLPLQLQTEKDGAFVEGADGVFVLDNGSLSRLGVLEPHVRRRYAARFLDDRAATDLACWDAFEAENPQTFRGMYRFWVQKPAASVQPADSAQLHRLS